ncbi:hypothetical protein Pmar_PMAR015629 [Perkinsus marinus ATCC 50983]|uniref:Uncharacterized protein n=1 Tax=Perkinsus marinus (strain ATCC 50983 / TXsc) TaxID=423536 RepID=C5K473_PERM5|nr:hypothetical protein Pmar_PMAR015629 [Perkinsus marinus ATCC 50983]EER20689.1 hypothetical protein Pmar_PMAR015629 [Perkinsus marinus ATCC 50983]|eukprot:XP_002788893.1 hypothetical protein Pmar_PMAR015629 [Perkinsus marinus ATCC 50983]
MVPSSVIARLLPLVLLVNADPRKYTGLTGINGGVTIVAEYDNHSLNLNYKCQQGGAGDTSGKVVKNRPLRRGQEPILLNIEEEAIIELVPSGGSPNAAFEDFKRECGGSFGKWSQKDENIRIFETSEKELMIGFLGKNFYLLRGEAPYPVGNYHLTDHKEVKLVGRDKRFEIEIDGEVILAPLEPVAITNRNHRLVNVLAVEYARNKDSLVSVEWGKFLKKYGKPTYIPQAIL